MTVVVWGIVVEKRRMSRMRWWQRKYLRFTFPHIRSANIHSTRREFSFRAHGHV